MYSSTHGSCLAYMDGRRDFGLVVEVIGSGSGLDGECSRPARKVAAGHFPRFSWTTLPVTWHGSVNSEWNATELAALAKYAAVTLEKQAGKDHLKFGKDMEHCQKGADASACGCCEEDLMVANFRKLRKVAPGVQNLAYTNSIIAYPWYSAAQNVFLKNSSYWLRNANGSLQHNIKQSDQTWYTWDFAVPAVVDIYKQQCLAMTKTGAVDGCYADGCENVPTPLDAATLSAYTASKRRMLADLQQQVPGLVICGSGGGTMKGVLGASVQNWGKHGDFSTREIPMLQRAVAAGAMFSAKGHAVCDNAGDPDSPAVQTELAAFLVAAGEYSYYRCGSWSHTDVPWYPVYDKKLGEPLGNATLANGVYTRAFKSGTKVAFDTKTEVGTIAWAK